ncbi:unnamed protein product [Penicillium glandicola]
MLSVVLLFIACLAFYKFILYPFYFSPLAKIPNASPWAPISCIWIQWKRYSGQEVTTFYQAFRDKGPVVRIGPDEVAVNDIEVVKTVHGYAQNNCIKPPWYSVFMHNDARNSFSSIGHDHSTRRHRVSPVYTKPFVQTSPHVRALLSFHLQQRMLPLINERAMTGLPLDVLSNNFAFSLDFVTSFLFGLPRCANFMQEDGNLRKWLDSYAKVYAAPLYWLQEFPLLVQWMRKLGIPLVSEGYFHDIDTFDEWIIPRVDATEVALAQISPDHESVKPGEFPVVYNQLRSAVLMNEAADEKSHLSASQRLEIASECLDHLDAQRKLRDELRSSPETFKFTPGQEHHIPSATTLENLPFLNAALKESIRLRGNVPTSNPRITHDAITDLGPYNQIPVGTRVSAFAWCLHRNEDIYPDAEKWIPERWLSAEGDRFEGGEQERWFWAFGTGSRRCLGQNLAFEMLRYCVAAIFTNFETTISDDSTFMGPDGFVTGKVGEKLDIRFKRVQ